MKKRLFDSLYITAWFAIGVFVACAALGYIEGADPLFLEEMADGIPLWLCMIGVDLVMFLIVFFLIIVFDPQNNKNHNYNCCSCSKEKCCMIIDPVQTIKQCCTNRTEDFHDKCDNV